jgi:ADP-ribose pyrophosphatase YjhB (NUDIX family)
MTEFFNVYKRDVRILLTEGLPEVVIEYCGEYEGEGGDDLTMGPMVQIYEFISPETGKVLCDTKTGNMPHWWKPPSDEVRKRLAKRYKAEGQVLPTTRNVVTLILFSDASKKLVMQVRGFVSPQGKPVSNAGKLSLHGGLMEDGESAFEALAREAKEELGIEITGTDVQKLFDHYDPENGRVNEVYELAASYREMLMLLENNAGPAIDALLNVEGIGRAFLDEANLKVAMSVVGAMTPITREILMRYFKLS